MRSLIAIATALFISGCGTDENLWQPYRTAAGAAQDALGLSRPPSPVQATLNARCVETARQRADDASANGEDEETAKAVYTGTYENCADWQKLHRL